MWREGGEEGGRRHMSTALAPADELSLLAAWWLAHCHTHKNWFLSLRRTLH